MIVFGRALLFFSLFFLAGRGSESYAKIIRVGVVQPVVEEALETNRAKIIGFIREAKAAGCQLAVFPENALYWPPEPGSEAKLATKADLDRAIEQIRRAAKANEVAVVFGAAYKNSDKSALRNRAFVFGPDGALLLAYWKNSEVPRPFDISGVRFALSICSDRGYLEHSDLPCLVAGAQAIIDTSGGHGGDDGRSALRWIRYRPWALRNQAYVIVSNPVHEDTDFMGNSPWGGGSAVVRPDGSIQASRVHEKDVLIVADLDTDRATLEAAERRRQHPLFGQFWKQGERLLKGESIAPGPEITPHRSEVRDIKIAAAQITCSNDLKENTRNITEFIRRAAREKADIVVFPELAVTGFGNEGVLAASQSGLIEALDRIREGARANRIYVIVGMPYFAEDARRNCAFVIGDDGAIQTRYAQIAPSRRDLFQAGESTKAMWFRLKGVHSIVTIGDDADWVEIGDLAANRGMCLHFHIANESHTSADDRLLHKQRNLLAVSYAQFGAVVNAADHSNGFPTRGGSLIVSREGGHEKPSPAGIEQYLPYQTSIVCSAGAEETILYATRSTSARNSLDLDRAWRNRQRKSRPQAGWHEWINTGVRLIDAEARK